MKLTVNTPEGTRDRLFSECQERRQVQSRLIRLFRQRGYLEVSTPETCLLYTSGAEAHRLLV